MSKMASLSNMTELFVFLVMIPSMLAAGLSPSCSLSPDRGTCKAVIPKVYFDQESNVCSNFTYGGCGGNENRFDTIKECEDMCKENGNVNSSRTKVEDGGEKILENGDTCSLASEYGTCRGSFTKIYFDQASKTCLNFTYGGCKGNANNFNTIEECEDMCKQNDNINIIRTKVEDGGEKIVENGDTCSLPYERGTCKAVIPKIYFDRESKSCLNFTYGGCEGNENRFDTIEECEDMCKQNDNINSIRTKVEKGEEVVENQDKDLVGDILSIDDEEMITEKLDFTDGFKDWTATNFKLINTSRVEESHGLTASPGEGDIVAKPEFSSTDTKMVGTMVKQLQVEENSLVELDFSIFVDGFEKQVGLDALLQNNPSFLIQSVSGEKSVTRFHLDDPRVKVTNGKWRKYRIPMRVEKTETIQLVLEARVGNGEHSIVAVDDVTIKRIPRAGQHLAAKEEVTSSTGSDVTSSSPAPAAETSGPALTVSASSNVSESQNTSGHQDSTSSTASTTTFYNNNTVINNNNTVINNTVINGNNTVINNNNTVTNDNSTVTNETLKSEEESGFVNRSAEIALIVLVVVFGLSTILLVLKYFHLKKHVGDFEIGTSRQTFDNPAYDTNNARYSNS